MGLRDLFRRSPPSAPPAPTERRFHQDRARMFDLAGTGVLAQLFAMPADERDRAWQESFFDLAWTASVAFAEPQTFIGPDGFPYLRLDLPHPGPFDSQCLGNVAGDCLAHGVGAALFASPDDPPERPQYVLSFGLIDSLVRFDSPWGDPIDIEEASLPDAPGAFDVEERASGRTMIVKEAHEVLVGAPSADFLPPYAARALAAHLEQVWGLEDPRVQLIADMQMRPHRSLVIGRKRGEFPEGAPTDEMARMLLWYLTPLRNVMLMPEDWTPNQMTPLRTLY